MKHNRFSFFNFNHISLNLSLQNSKGFLYEEIALKIEQQIETGILAPGEKLTSVRKLSQQLDVSMSTAFQAYFSLENKGLIEARPRSGFYVRCQIQHRPVPPKKSITSKVPTEVNIDDLVSRLVGVSENKVEVPFGTARPDSRLLPTQKLNKTLLSVARNSEKEIIEYDFTSGNSFLREQLSFLSFNWGKNLMPEEIVTTTGCMEALNLSLRAVTKPGDTIAIESPTFYGVLQCIESLGLKVVEISTDPDTGICLDELETAITKQDIKACLVISNFNNPLGSCIPDIKKKELVQLLFKHNIPLIEDDVYGDLYFGSKRPITAKAFDEHGMVLLCSSFSKTLAPGYRVGWVAPGKFLNQIKRLKFMTSIASPSLQQMAIAEFIKKGEYTKHLKVLRSTFSRQVLLATQIIIKYFPEGTKVTHPKGGCFLWIELPGNINTLKLYYKAMEFNIEFLPGILFSTQKKFRNFMRISCSLVWENKAEEALKTIGQILLKELK